MRSSVKSERWAYLKRLQKSAPFIGAEWLPDAPELGHNRASPHVNDCLRLEDIKSVVGRFVSKLLQGLSHGWRFARVAEGEDFQSGLCMGDQGSAEQMNLAGLAAHDDGFRRQATDLQAAAVTDNLQKTATSHGGWSEQNCFGLDSGSCSSALA
ncbi:unnamed protein product [Mycena citricolor]|uniref:Uncharacterized protein n=1 Tax=Mycena citricolor TaxID=2018698 RepID=A0AAD2HEP9_9AGAR|nr:unnamed protein product [Mycena citricolor]